MAEITNDLTWSISRAGLFQSCQRAYYSRYYGYWGGWKFDADEKATLLYVLRNVKPMILWAGTIVHETIKDALTRYAATGEVPTPPALQQHATELLRAGWLETINKEWQERPSKKTNLFELYYGDGENYGECKHGCCHTLCNSTAHECVAGVVYRRNDLFQNLFHLVSSKNIFT